MRRQRRGRLKRTLMRAAADRVTAQIGRWLGVAGPRGRWMRNLVNQCMRGGKAFDDRSVSPVIRQLLLHWAYDPPVADFGKTCAHIGNRKKACPTGNGKRGGGSGSTRRAHARSPRGEWGSGLGSTRRAHARPPPLRPVPPPALPPYAAHPATFPLALCREFCTFVISCTHPNIKKKGAACTHPNSCGQPNATTPCPAPPSSLPTPHPSPLAIPSSRPSFRCPSSPQRDGFGRCRARPRARAG